MVSATHLALRTPLCDLLGIAYPICQAGMGYVARAALVAVHFDALALSRRCFGQPDQRLDCFKLVEEEPALLESLGSRQCCSSRSVVPVAPG